MRLTKYHKEAFVMAVMADVPKHDFADDYAKLIKADMLENATPKIRAILTDSDVSHLVLTGRDSVRAESIKIDNRAYCYWELQLGSPVVYNGYEKSKSVKAAESRLAHRAAEQMLTRKKLKASVEGIIGSCYTLKSAHERLPEFTKYLPEAEVKGSLLPAIANLAAELVKAGWPQGKPEAVAA